MVMRAHLGEVEIMAHLPFVLAVLDFSLQPLTASLLGEWEAQWAVGALELLSLWTAFPRKARRRRNLAAGHHP